MVFHGIIYKITNLINGKIYIGQTTLSLHQRWYGHYAKNKRYTMVISNAIRKYGKENFKIEEIDGANSLSELNYKEKHWINYLDSQNKALGYNIANGGHHERPTLETRERQRLAQQFTWSREFTVHRVSEDKTLVLLGIWDNKTQCERALQLRPKSLSAKLKSRGKISYVGQIICQYIDERVPNYTTGILRTSKLFRVFKKDNKEYVSSWYNQKQCAMDLDIDHSAVSKCLKNQLPYHKGYVFCYHDQDVLKIFRKIKQLSK